MLNKLQKKRLTLLMKKFKNQNQSLKLHQLQLLNKLHPKLIGAKLTRNKLLKVQINLFIPHSHQVILKLLTQFQITSHHLKKTLLKVDMLQFSSSLHLNKNLCTKYMKTSNISINFMITLKVSDFLFKTLVLVWVKLDNSMKVFNKWLLSTHLQLNSWKFLLKAKDLYTLKVLLRDI